MFTTWNLFSKNSPTYPWNIPQIPNQQFMKEFLSFGASGMPGGMLQGYVAVLLDIKKKRDSVKICCDIHYQNPQVPSWL